MTQEVDWDGIDNNSGYDNSDRRPKVDYLRVPDGGRSRIRLVSKPMQYYKHWDPIMAYSPGKETDPLFAAGYKASRNYGLYVIDRADGSVKVFNCSKKILMMFKEWKSIKGHNPEDFSKGSDWVISKARVDNKWQYNAMHIEEAPLTEDEVNSVNSTIEEKPLSAVFKPHTVEELQEMLDSYKANPAGPRPGTGKWYKEKREKEKGANGGGNSGANVRFDEDKNAADVSDTGASASAEAGSSTEVGSSADSNEEAYENLFDETGKGEDSSASLF